MATKKNIDKRKIWMVPHPISQFVEDVKDLAVMGRLRIVDSIFAKEFPAKMIATETPKLTKKPKATKAKGKATAGTSDALAIAEAEARTAEANATAKEAEARTAEANATIATANAKEGEGEPKTPDPKK